MQRHRFGRRAESLPEDQLLLGLEDAEQGEAATLAAADSEPASRATRVAERRHNWGALPAHLPRIERVVDPASLVCPCCAGTLHRIGEDVCERLDVVPAQVRVLVIRRPRYACRACEEAVVQAPAPACLIEGGLPSDALVAQVLVPTTYRSTDRRRSSRCAPCTNACWRSYEPAASCLPTRPPTGARSRARPHQDGPAVGLRAGRPALGRARSAGRGLRLRPRPHG
jgi:transposase